MKLSMFSETNDTLFLVECVFFFVQCKQKVQILEVVVAFEETCLDFFRLFEINFNDKITSNRSQKFSLAKTTFKIQAVFLTDLKWHDYEFSVAHGCLFLWFLFV